MAERRMFSKTVIDSDLFLDMPVSAQLLYFHLAMRADDDGFINKPKSVVKICGLSADDMEELVKNGYIICFDSGVTAITHWRLHNSIRKDRYRPSLCPEVNLVELDEYYIYRIAANGMPNNSILATQDRLGQDSVGKVSLDEDRKDKDSSGKFSSVEDKKDKDSSVENRQEQNVGSVVRPQTDSYFGRGSDVSLTDEQCGELASMSSVESVEKYIKKLSDWQTESGKRCRDPYRTIKQWIIEDKFRDINTWHGDGSPKQGMSEKSSAIEEYESFAMNYDLSNAPLNLG